MTTRIEEIEDQISKVTTDLQFWQSLGGQLCCDWPRKIWDDPVQVQRDVRFHSDAYKIVSELLTEFKKLQTERDTYRQALGVVQKTLVMSSSMKAWQLCTDAADKALNGEYVHPDSATLAQMKWERDQAREALKPFSELLAGEMPYDQDRQKAVEVMNYQVTK